MRKFLMIVFIGILVIFFSCSDDEEHEPTELNLEYTFETGLEGWNNIFADYPVGQEESMDLNFEHDNLPSPLDETEMAARIEGTNTSDDLFMGMYRKIDGLEPNEDYEVFFDLSIASDAPEESVGVGGSPGASVYVKVGAVIEQPRRETDELNWYRLILDKGNQASEGEDMINIGNVGIPGDEFVFTLINRTNENRPFQVRTNNEGVLWLIVGTDSGFESTTTLYYNKIEIRIR